MDESLIVETPDWDIQIGCPMCGHPSLTMHFVSFQCRQCQWGLAVSEALSNLNFIMYKLPKTWSIFSRDGEFLA